jgi:hypothetical protein
MRILQGEKVCCGEENTVKQKAVVKLPLSYVVD